MIGVAAQPLLAATVVFALGWIVADRYVPSALVLRARRFRHADGMVPAESAMAARFSGLVTRLAMLAAAPTRRDAAVAVRRAGCRSPAAADRLVASRLVLPVLLPCIGLMVQWPRLATDAPAVLALLLAIAVAGRFGPGLLMTNMATRRMQAIALGLPDAIDLLVICAEAGLGIEAALARTARELAPAQPEVAFELDLTATELGLLPYRADCFANLARRVPLPQVQALADMLVQTERFGTPLSHSLRVLAAEYRTGRLLRAEEAAAKLPAMMTVPMIAFILPPLFIVLIGPAIINALAN